jgi:3-hydroxy-5-methyl-1-naphthoate 3-O-methyltransferase
MSALETSHQSGQSRPLSPQRISEMAWGFAPPLILEAAIRTKVFDVLDSGPKTIDELSAATKTSPRGLRAILNALVGFDLLTRDGDRYALTEESAAFLVSTKPSFQGGIDRHISSQLIPAWLDIEQIVRTGKADRPVNQQESGAEFFAQFVEDILPITELGDTFTFSEISDWLKEAGFEKPRQLDAPSVSPLILANKPRSG